MAERGADLKYIIGFQSNDTPVVQATKSLNKLVAQEKLLNKAFKENLISSAIYKKGIKEVREEVNRLKTAVAAGGAALDKYNAGLVQSKNKMNKFGMVSQQVGYQVGDFFVQVQSGTSALVAFGQQGTQLAGLLPGVTGAIVGISLAVGTMLARSFMEANQELEPLIDRLQELPSLYDDIDNISTTLSGSIVLPWMEGAAAIDVYLAKLQETKQQDISKTLGDLLGQRAGLFSVKGARSALGISSGAIGLGAGFEDAIAEAKEEIQELKDILSLGYTTKATEGGLIVSVEGEIERLQGRIVELKAEYTDLKAAFLEPDMEKKISSILSLRQEYVETLGDDSTAVAAIDELIKEAGLTEEILKTREKQLEVAEDLLELENDAIKGINKFYNREKKEQDKAAARQAKLLKSAQDQLAVEKLRLTSLQGYNSEGEKTQDILDAEVALAAEIVKKKWEQKFALNGISQEEQKLIAALVDQAELQERAEQSIKKAKDDAREFAKEMASAARASEKLANFLGKSDDKLPALRAKLSVLRAGGSRGEADIAGARAGAKSALSEQLGSMPYGPDRAKIEAVYIANKTEEARLQAEINELLKTKKELTNIKDDIRDAEEKLKLDRASVFATREEIGYLTILRDLKQANKDADIGMDPSALDKTAKRLAQYQEETKHLEDLRDLTTDWAQSFGDAIVSVVDGTEKAKDAFNNLALAIVKDLYDIFVVKQITGFITGTVGSTWSDLGKVGAPSMGDFDGGGYTGNGPRSGGLDGKGGFMAMLHPRETVVDHTKGGSSGVVVNQTINVSTGVQQTVRAEVMGLMPQIAAASKGAVLDAKRRGGAYAGAF
jgi:hypothetical protein